MKKMNDFRVHVLWHLEKDIYDLDAWYENEISRLDALYEDN